MDRTVFGIGETVLDIIFKNDTPLAANPGGSVFNSMISLGRSGVPATFVSQTGEDHVGDIVVNFLRDNGVCTDYVYRQPNSKSHISLAFLNEQNDAQYQFYKDHATVRLTPDFPNVKPDDVVMFGSFFAINPVIRSEVRTFLQHAKDRGAMLYYDINFRKPHVADLPQCMPNLIENLSMSDVVRGSSEDFEILFGERDSSAIYERFIKPYCACLVYTDGAQDIRIHTPELHLTFPVEQIPTVSTVGAGDSFNAGFVYGLIREQIGIEKLSKLQSEDWAKLVEYGQQFSREVCQSMENYISKKK